MEIRTTRTNSYDFEVIHTLRTRRKGIQADLAQKDCKQKIDLQVHCNLRKPVNFFLLLLVVFSNMGFHVKSLVFVCVLY